MLIENGPDVLNQHSGVTTFLWALLARISDPAVLTAIASLLTAIAAFFRARHRHNGEQAVSPRTPPSETPLSRAYETLHDVEERIREELLQQLQNLQEEAEIIDQDLAAYQQANIALKDLVLRCSVPACPARGSLLKER